MAPDAQGPAPSSRGPQSRRRPPAPARPPAPEESPMCPLIALWRVVDGYDLVVGMNRDESANRPSEPPSLREGDPVLVAPRDLAAGGTWIGANANGLLLALSN